MTRINASTRTRVNKVLRDSLKTKSRIDNKNKKKEKKKTMSLSRIHEKIKKARKFRLDNEFYIHLSTNMLCD